MQSKGDNFKVGKKIGSIKRPVKFKVTQLRAKYVASNFRRQVFPLWAKSLPQCPTKLINDSYPSSRVPNWSIFRSKPAKDSRTFHTTFHRHFYFPTLLLRTQLRWPILLLSSDFSPPWNAVGLCPHSRPEGENPWKHIGTWFRDFKETVFRRVLFSRFQHVNMKKDIKFRKLNVFSTSFCFFKKVWTLLKINLINWNNQRVKSLQTNVISQRKIQNRAYQ